MKTLFEKMRGNRQVAGRRAEYRLAESRAALRLNEEAKKEAEYINREIARLDALEEECRKKDRTSRFERVLHVMMRITPFWEAPEVKTACIARQSVQDSTRLK